MKIEHKAVPVMGLKVLADEGEGIIAAIVSVTGLVDNVKDNIKPGAYAKTLTVRKPKGVYSHSWEKPVSKALEVRELMPGDPLLKEMAPHIAEKGGGGLYVKMQYNLGTQRGREAYADAVFYGEEQEWSIGYNVPTGGSKIDSKSGVREIDTMDLFEFSQVLFGAAPQTAGTTMVKDALAEAAADGYITEEDLEEFVEFVSDLKSLSDDEVGEIVRALPDDALQALVTIGFEADAEAKGSGGTTTPADRYRARHLIRWFERGEGAAKIRWGTPGDFMRCVRIASKHMTPENAKGFCNLRHRGATGAAPGKAPSEQRPGKSAEDLLDADLDALDAETQAEYDAFALEWEEGVKAAVEAGIDWKGQPVEPLHVCDVAECEQGFKTLEEVQAHEATHRTEPAEAADRKVFQDAVAEQWTAGTYVGIEAVFEKHLVALVDDGEEPRFWAYGYVWEEGKAAPDLEEPYEVFLDADLAEAKAAQVEQMKVARVLSGRNRAKITAAVEALQAVLEADQPKPSEDSQEEKTAVVEEPESKVRKVRTAEGARRYGVPIGSPITDEVAKNVDLGKVPRFAASFGDVRVGHLIEDPRGGDAVLEVTGTGDAIVARGPRGALRIAPGKTPIQVLDDQGESGQAEMTSVLARMSDVPEMADALKKARTAFESGNRVAAAEALRQAHRNAKSKEYRDALMRAISLLDADGSKTIETEITAPPADATLEERLAWMDAFEKTLEAEPEEAAEPGVEPYDGTIEEIETTPEGDPVEPVEAEAKADEEPTETTVDAEAKADEEPTETTVDAEFDSLMEEWAATRE